MTLACRTALDPACPGAGSVARVLRALAEADLRQATTTRVAALLVNGHRAVCPRCLAYFRNETKTGD